MGARTLKETGRGTTLRNHLGLIALLVGFNGVPGDEVERLAVTPGPQFPTAWREEFQSEKLDPQLWTVEAEEGWTEVQVGHGLCKLTVVRDDEANRAHSAGLRSKQKFQFVEATFHGVEVQGNRVYFGIVIGLVPGDWFDAARLYRRWATRQKPSSLKWGTGGRKAIARWRF